MAYLNGKKILNARVVGGYEEGRNAERNAFWEDYQQSGKRKNYTYAFYGAGWTDDNYDPIYPIVCTQANAVFGISQITDTKVSIDVTNCVTNCTPFNWATKLVTVQKYIVSENTSYGATFEGCSALKNITFEGVIGNNIDFSACTKLTHDSLMSTINHLATVSTTKTLTLGAANLAKLTDAEKAIATDKGWTLA